MSETVNQEKQNTNNANTGTAPERTFTQAELDAVISERLSRERAKYADYETLKQKAVKFDEAEEASKSELQKAQEKASAYKEELDRMKKAESVRSVREKVAKDTGVPVSLLSGETEEACTEQAQAILAFAKPTGYPSVKDGGEVTRHTKGTAQESFAEWFKNVQK